MKKKNSNCEFFFRRRSEKNPAAKKSIKWITKATTSKSAHSANKAVHAEAAAVVAADSAVATTSKEATRALFVFPERILEKLSYVKKDQKFEG